MHGKPSRPMSHDFKPQYRCATTCVDTITTGDVITTGVAIMAGATIGCCTYIDGWIRGAVVWYAHTVFEFLASHIG